MLRTCFIISLMLFQIRNGFILECFEEYGHQSCNCYLFDFRKPYTSLALYLSQVSNAPVVISTLEKSILKFDVLVVRSLSVQMCVQLYQLNTSH
jgi:hypothetical protein